VAGLSTDRRSASGYGAEFAGVFRKQAWHGSHVVKVFLRDVFRCITVKLCSLRRTPCFAWDYSGWDALGTLLWRARLFPLAGLLAILLPRLRSLRVRCLKRQVGRLLPLTALYFTYGLARARALLKIGTSSRLLESPDTNQRLNSSGLRSHVRRRIGLVEPGPANTS